MYEISKKICIVGSGFCGYAVYKRLSELGYDIILIEEEILKRPIEEDQSYYRMTTNKQLKIKLLDNYIKEIKNRLNLSFKDRKYTLGGSSECWTGWIKPFEKSTYKNFYKNKPSQKLGRI